MMNWIKNKIVMNNEEKAMKFRYIVEFDTCDNCPFNEFVDDDYSPTHKECERTNEYIMTWTNTEGEKDFRNPETGILDDCPFIENNTIIE